jgi:tetratricopeptide (TPR) repeat protein
LGQRELQAETLAVALDAAPDDAGRARVLAEQVVWLTRRGSQQEALSVSESALRAAAASGEPSVVALCLGRRAEALMGAGQLREAADHLERMGAEMAGNAPQLGAMAAEWRARLASMVGDIGEARFWFTQAVELYQAAGDAQRAAANEANLADILNRFGAHVEAELALDGALSTCRRVGNSVIEGYALANLGYSCTMQGKFAEATLAIDEADAIALKLHDARLRITVRLYRARLVFEGGKNREAQELACEVARECAELAPTIEAVALGLAARAALRGHDHEEALDLSERALDRRDALGGIEENEAELFVTRAEALDAAGRSEQAREVRERGRARLPELAGRIRDPEWRRHLLSASVAHRSLCGEEGG